VLSQTGGVFSVFTPYKNAWLKKLAADPSVLAPYNIEPHAARLAPRQRRPGAAHAGRTGLRAEQPGRAEDPDRHVGRRLFEDFLPRIAATTWRATFRP
jgi:deoxyribodipyrimidine photo-lyase